MRTKMMALAAAAGVVALTGPAVAGEDASKAEKMVEYRQAVFTVMAHNIHPLGGMAKGEVPYDAEAFARRADNIAAAAPMALEGFKMEGTADVEGSEAKAKIRDNMDDFEDMMGDMTEAADKLAAMEPGNSIDSVKKPLKALADTCEDCHDEYKEDD